MASTVKTIDKKEVPVKVASVFFIYATLFFAQSFAHADAFMVDLTCSGTKFNASLELDMSFTHWQKESAVIERGSGRVIWSIKSPTGSLKLDDKLQGPVNLFSDQGIGSSIALRSPSQNVSSFLDFQDNHFHTPGSFILISKLSISPVIVGSILNLYFERGRPVKVETGEGSRDLCSGLVRN